MMIKTLEQRKAEALKALNTFHGTTSVVSHGINKGSFNTVLLTNEQREKLLPDNCPLCDKKVEVKFNEGCVYTDFHGFERHSKDTYVIECRNKHSVRVTNTDKLEAIKSWNTRNNPHAEIAEELVKALVYALQDAKIIAEFPDDAVKYANKTIWKVENTLQKYKQMKGE